MNEKIIKAVQAFLSDVSVEYKISTIHKSLDGGATYDEITTFLNKHVNLNQLLQFMQLYSIHRPVFPLFIRVHLLHLTQNPLLISKYIPIEIQAYPNKSLYENLPSILSYVMQRLAPDEDFETQSGWTIMNRNEANQIVSEYTNKCNEIQFFESLWFNSTIIALMYMGMGHYQILGFHLKSRTFFSLIEGGSNAYDRETNFEEALKITESSLDQIKRDWSDVKNNFCTTFSCT